MSVYAPVTPQRPLPGHYIQTPAPNQPNFGQQAQQPRPGLVRGGSQFGSTPALPAPQQNGALVRPSGQSQPPAQLTNTGGASLSAAQRAAKAINESLQQDAKYPAFDDYVTQGISSDYEITADATLAPFQRIRMYDIPDRVFEQYNQAQLHTMMGLFAELNHAWVVIDNALYLWDYTAPNPDLIGFEEQSQTIMAVKLVAPKKGVFVAAITHLLVVATTSDILLIGLATEKNAGGIITVQLYQTKMQVSIKGIDVSHIAGCPKSGRIFFGGHTNNDIWELTYQQEEKWFSSRCTKVNHTSQGVYTVLPALEWRRGPPEHVTQVVVDETRNLVYTLSNSSTIRVFHMPNATGLNLAVTETIDSILTRVGHMVSRTELLYKGQTTIVSLSPIKSQEASRLALVATTNTGCRIIFSATSGGYYSSDPTGPPRSIAIHHIFFPPSEHQIEGQQAQSSYGTATQVDTNSKYLAGTYEAFRFPPGFFLCTVRPNSNVPTDNLFLSCPDPGRLASRPDAQQGSQKLVESGIMLNMSGVVQDVGLTTAPFQASNQPAGFGNELAVQFTAPVSEIAVLTSTGIQTIRRRRLVDLFAAILRAHKINDEMIEDAVNNFARLYGRAEAMASTLAVACGQAIDVTADGARLGQITDPEVVDAARKVFITQGGKPVLNENAVVDRNTAPTVDNVSPSPRYYGMTRYVARLLRGVWSAPVVKETPNPAGGLLATSSVPLASIREVQRNLSSLQEFLNNNKTFIDGLAGPEALGRVGSKQEEMALQGEHRALNSLVKLIGDVIEGISFVIVLFDNKVDEILLTLPEQSRQQVRQLTFESLFTSDNGKQLAKELVKAIVERNIAAGSNVETVAESLRRKCGSFCSSDDVIIFKAQENLKRAEEAGKDSEAGRRQLNDSLRLFERVASNLRMEVIRPAVDKYVALEFWAGSLELVLEVAKQSDRANRALSWVKDGSPDTDDRKAAYEQRKACYDLVHEIIEAVDRVTSQQQPSDYDLRVSTSRRRRDEAYAVIDTSTDELFQTNLYDWYLERGWADRLLDIRAPFVISYLQRKSLEDVKHADLLWKYYAHYGRYFEAGTVQLQLAKSGFPLPLDARIEYLSRAKANASTRVGAIESGFGRSAAGQGRQETIREISDLLDLAGVQEDVWTRLSVDPRLPADKKPEIEAELNGEIKSLDELYNNYIDQAGYFDLALLMFPLADHRNAADIASTWANLIDKDHSAALDAFESEEGQQTSAQPWEVVAERVREMGQKLQLSEVYFPIGTVLPLLARYHVNEVLDGSAVVAQGSGPSSAWVPSIFIDLGVPYESVVAALESVFYSNEQPFTGRKNRGIVGAWLIYAVGRWLEDSSVDGLSAPFGSLENAVAVAEGIRGIEGSGVLGARETEEARRLRGRIESFTR